MLAAYTFSKAINRRVTTRSTRKASRTCKNRAPREGDHQLVQLPAVFQADMDLRAAVRAGQGAEHRRDRRQDHRRVEHCGQSFRPIGKSAGHRGERRQPTRSRWRGPTRFSACRSSTNPDAGRQLPRVHGRRDVPESRGVCGSAGVSGRPQHTSRGWARWVRCCPNVRGPMRHGHDLAVVKAHKFREHRILGAAGRVQQFHEPSAAKRPGDGLSSPFFGQITGKGGSAQRGVVDTHYVLQPCSSSSAAAAQDCPAILDRAQRAFEHRQFRVAAAELEAARPNCPADRVRIDVALGQTQYLLGEEAEAEQSFQAAVALGAEESRRRCTRWGGCTRCRIGIPEAVERLEAAVADRSEELQGVGQPRGLLRRSESRRRGAAELLQGARAGAEGPPDVRLGARESRRFLPAPRSEREGVPTCRGGREAQSGVAAEFLSDRKGAGPAGEARAEPAVARARGEARPAIRRRAVLCWRRRIASWGARRTRRKPWSGSRKRRRHGPGGRPNQLQFTRNAKSYFFPSRILRSVPPKMFACASCPTPQASSIFR